MACLEGVAQGGVVGQPEPARQVLGDEQHGSDLVLAGLLSEPPVAQGQQLVDGVLLEGMVVPHLSHRLADPGHRDAAEDGGALEVPLPVLAGGVVSSGREKAVEIGGRRLGNAQLQRVE